MKGISVIFVVLAVAALVVAVDEASVSAKLKSKFAHLPNRAFEVVPIPKQAETDAEKIGVSFFAKGSRQSGRAVAFRVAVLPFPNAFVARFAKSDSAAAEAKPSAFAAAVGLLGLVEYEPEGDGGFVPGTSTVLRRVFLRRAFSELSEWTRTLETTTVDSATVYTWTASHTGDSGATLTVSAQISTETVELEGSNKTRTVAVPNGFELTFAADNLPYTTATSQWAYLTVVQTRSRPATDAAAAEIATDGDADTDSEVLELSAESTEDSVGGQLRFRRTVNCYQKDAEDPIQGTINRSKFTATFPRGKGAVEDHADTTSVVDSIEADLADSDGAANRPGFVRNGKTNFVLHSVLCKDAGGARFQPESLVWDPTVLVSEDDEASAAATIVPSVLSVMLAAVIALLMF